VLLQGIQIGLQDFQRRKPGAHVRHEMIDRCPFNVFNVARIAHRSSNLKAGTGAIQDEEG
jgi:hypothetical protein